MIADTVAAAQQVCVSAPLGAVIVVGAFFLGACIIAAKVVEEDPRFRPRDSRGRFTRRSGW